MYRCTDCGKKFEKFKVLSEGHGLDTPPFEKIAVCPECGEGDVTEISVKHCRCCGARLPEGREEYCNSECLHRGRILWQREQRRRRAVMGDPINLLVGEIENYNREHKTRYSYGQYVALFKNNARRKKNANR